MLANFIRKKVDNNVEKVGLQSYFKSVLEKSESKIIINLDKKTEEILKNKPVILISNHPNEFDPVAIISSLPKRKNYFIIFTHIFMNIVKDLDHHIIPVFIQHDTKQLIPGKKFLLRILFNYGTFSAREEHEKNLKSIKNASKKIDQGSMVIITPSGRSKKIKWYSGIGHLIKGVNNAKSVYIVFLYIKGTSGLDMLRFIPKSGKILPEITLNYSKPKKIKELKKNNPKIITKELEKEYKKWVNSLSFK